MRSASSCCGNSEEKMPSQGFLQGSGITSRVTASQLSSGHLVNLIHGLFWQNIPVLKGHVELPEHRGRNGTDTFSGLVVAFLLGGRPYSDC